MQIQTAELSLIGRRENNQDRVSIVQDDRSAMAIVVDGMGGHAEGARAAEVALECFIEAFSSSPRPIVDPMGFLRLTLTQAHAAVVALGRGLPIQVMPRATCAVCLLQDGQVSWGHVGDSRVYLLREGRLVTRTRDHSHVEVLRREGLISEQDMQTHPMRNYVEFCLGGEPEVPGMDVAPVRSLDRNDVLLVCSDGFWSGLDERSIAALSKEPPDEDIEGSLRLLAERAVRAGEPHSDNTTAAVVRWISP